MDNSDLLRQVIGSLGPDSVNTLAAQVGASPQQTAQALEVALPLLLGGLGRNAAQPGGADAIQAAVRRDHSGLDLGNVLGQVLGGGGDGAAILGHVLGSRQNNAAGAVSQASGLGKGQAMQLLAMLAPLVMAYLGRGGASGAQASGGGGLSDILGQLGRQFGSGGGGIGGALATAVLDKDGDGDVDFSDLLGSARSTGDSPSRDGGLGGLIGSIFGKN